MAALLRVSGAIDLLTGLLGRWISWLVVLAILVSAGNAVVRKAWDTSSNAWLELQWLLFGAVFLLAAPWTLARGEHVRIDVVSSRFPPWLRSAVDLIGHATFLVPMATVLVVTSWPVFLASAPRLAEVVAALQGFEIARPLDSLGRILTLGEQSANAGGLPLWPAKLLIPVGFALLLVQAVAEICKRLAILLGAPEETRSEAHPAQVMTEAPDAGAADRGPDPQTRRPS